ncbi:hypothetical protein ACXR0O_21710 [Verrucomicrobiota bacterium sgz303538]
MLHYALYTHPLAVEAASLKTGYCNWLRVGQRGGTKISDLPWNDDRSESTSAGDTGNFDAHPDFHRIEKKSALVSAILGQVHLPWPRRMPSIHHQ